MRMSIYDISDVAYDAYLLNGQSKKCPWIAPVKVGDVVRLRFIGAPASTIYRVKIAGTKNRLVLQSKPLRFIVLVGQQRAGNFSAQTSRKPDETCGMLLENLLVNAGLVVKALQMRGGDQLDEIFIAGGGFRKKDEVVVIFSLGAGAFIKPVFRDVHFASDDGLDAGFLRFLVKLNRAVQHAVVGERNGVHPKLFGAGDQIINFRKAVQEGIVAMSVEVDETHDAPS